MADKWLLMRFGGIGDSMCVTTAAKAIKEIYPEDTIDYATREQSQVDMVKNLDLFNRVFEMKRFPHPVQGMNCYKTKDGWESMEALKKSGKYKVVIDFVNCIENNTVHPELVPIYGEWAQSMNSNFINWTDIHIAWCRIDPMKIKDKRPAYRVEPEEREWAESILKNYPKPHIGINMFASSRARTYFDVQSLVNHAIGAIPEATFFVWDNTQWLVIRKGGMKPFGEKTDVRKSAALVEQFDCFIGADSGFSHIAEAVGTHNVAIYTTVPAWTRNMYYQYSHDIDVEPSCSPCFTLHSLCPINRRRAMESLSDRERSILQLSHQNVPIEVAANQLSTSPDKLTQEFQAINAKMDGLASVVPDCIASVTPDMVVEKIQEALDAYSNEIVGKGEVDCKQLSVLS